MQNTTQTIDKVKSAVLRSQDLETLKSLTVDFLEDLKRSIKREENSVVRFGELLNKNSMQS